MQFVNELQVEIKLYQNYAALHTQRLQVQQAKIFLGNLAGSIIGILGVVGFLMNNFEKTYEHIVRKMNTKRTRKLIVQNGIQIISKNFDMSYKGALLGNRVDASSIDYLNRSSNEQYTITTFRAEDPKRFQVEPLPPP